MTRLNFESSAVCVLLSALLCGCAGDYVARTRDVRRAYEAGETDAALQKLKPERSSPKDKLLALLDEGMVLHSAGRWAESIAVLGEADKLSQQLDVISVSEEAATLLTNERERAYRGEDFEKLMISVLQALNYAALSKDEDALVEVRRVNERMRKMIVEEKKPYEQLAFARYLGGVLYEDQGELDSAFIDYQEAARLNTSLGELAEPLARLAKQTGRDDAYARWKRPSFDDTALRPNEGQVVVVIEAGRSPEKESANRAGSGEGELIPVPRYRDRGAPDKATVSVGGKTARSETVTSLRQVAKVHLDDRVGRMVARGLASTALKAGLAAGVGVATRSEQLGVLAFLLLNATNAPDLRSWLSLPADLQIARLRLPAGKHELTVSSGGKTSTHAIDVRPRRISLVVLRTY